MRCSTCQEGHLLSTFSNLCAFNKETKWSNFKPFSFSTKPFILGGEKHQGHYIWNLYKVLIQAHNLLKTLLSVF